MERAADDAPPITAAPNSLQQATERQAFYALMLLSGFAGLGYEMVWTKMLAVSLGHEIVAVLAVIAAFFVGLAVGAWLLDSRIRQSAKPHYWYAGLEVVIGGWALVLVGLVPWFNDRFPVWLGIEPTLLTQWSAVFSATLLLLLPATAAMGATLPAMERVLSGRQRDGWRVGGLYAANTMGAVAGTLTATFLLAPALGFTATLFTLAAVNFLCAIAILLMTRKSPADVPGIDAQPNGAPAASRLTATLALTGFLGIGYEVVVIRVLSQVLENTVYTFASLLSVFLLGTALGAALYQQSSPRDDYEGTFARLLGALAAACLLGLAVLYVSDSVHFALTRWLGNGYGPAVAGELLVAASVLLLPTVVMGALFAHLAQAARDTIGVGRAVAINTFFGAAAPVVFGVVLLPLAGGKIVLLLIAFAYLLLLPKRKHWISATAILPAIAAVLLGLFLPGLRFVSIPDGGRVLSYSDGIMASVAVVEDAAGVRFLKVNNHYSMGSSASVFSDRRQTHIPLLLHPDPESALFLGLGTGSTFAATAAHRGLDALAVELVPEVTSTVEYFVPNFETLEPNIRVSDARRFVRADDTQYDVIIADVFHPSRDGAGSLYTVEHFEAVQARLAERGLFCQWLPLFQLDLETLANIIRSFQTVFPDAQAHLAHFSLGQPIIGLVGWNSETPRYYRGYLVDRVGDAGLIDELNALRLNTDFALLGGFIAGPEALQAFAQNATLNTDDLPVVSYQAPGFVYGGPEPAYTRLLSMLAELETTTEALIDAGAPQPSEFASRLEDYWRARNEFLAAGVGVRPSDDLQLMLTQIREPLLNVLLLSEDFVPAYRPLLELARELAATRPDVSKQLLLDLEATAPSRGEAAALRRRLFADSP
ncbi:MAG: fused MFS/spermidine synthase [Pseudomonadota bacterium]